MMLYPSFRGWTPETNITQRESATHMSLWAILSAPLIIGLDLTQPPTWAMSIISNAEMLAINQDVLGAQGASVAEYTEGSLVEGVCTFGKCVHTEIWSKACAHGSFAVALVNRGGRYDQDDSHFGPEVISFDMATLIGDGSFVVRDVWAGKDLGVFNGTFVTLEAIEPHAAMLVKLTPEA